VSLLTRILGPVEKRATLRDADGWLYDFLVGGSGTVSGEVVGPNNALGVAVYFACLRVISEDIAKLPLPIFRRIDEHNRDKLHEHPLHWLLNVAPNPDMTAISFRETLTHHALGWGGGFAEIIRSNRGVVSQLWVLDPSRISIARDTLGGPLIYTVRPSGREPERRLLGENVLHIHGMGFEGITGYSLAEYAKETLGLGIASEKHGAAFFGNSSRPAGILQHPGIMEKEERTRLRESFEKMYGGASNSNRTVVLENGVDFKPVAQPAKDAQWIESRHFGVEEICRFCRVSPHMVQHLIRATFNNIEALGIEHVMYTLMPWAVRGEQEIRRKLISEDQPDIHAEHNMTALLRGDQKSQAEAFKTAIQNGWMTHNEARGLLNMNSIGEDGDQHWMPVNMQPIDKFDEEPAPSPVVPPAEESDGDDDDEARASMVERLAGVHERHVRAEIVKLLHLEAEKAAKASKGGRLSTWKVEFYGRHAEHVREALIPVVDTFVDTVWAASNGGVIPVQIQQDLGTLTDEMAQRHVAKSLAEVETDRFGSNGRVKAQVDEEMRHLVRFVLERLAN
jgi:HK97 family phage portal protein